MNARVENNTNAILSPGIVLVVDDSPANLEVVAEYLNAHGLETAIASDGHIALKRARYLKPDLILLDILMPGMDGLETCRQLKADEETRDIPVIFMTSLTDGEYKTKGFSAGAVDYVTKPIQHEELLARVRTHLEIQQYRKHLEKAVRKRTLELEKRTAELEMANNQLTQLHNTFLTVLDSIDATIYVADMQTHEILFMNQYMKKLHGADYTGLTCWRAFQGEDGPCAACPEGKLLEADGLPTGVYTWERKCTITHKWFMNSDRAIKWIDDRYVHIQVAMDITKIKALEEERVKSEILLRQAQKMEAIGTLAGGIAHDFNNMLSPIIGYVELVMHDLPGDHNARGRLKKVLAAANRAKDLVMQILNFSRQSDYEPKPLKVQTVIKEVLKLIKSTLPATIEVHQEIDERCRSVVADPAKVHQIFMNLITNAYHAMEDTGGKLTVVLKEVELADADVDYLHIPSGTYICFQVSDTGMGMNQATVDRIFDPYFTTKERGKGTGLGLAVVQGIVNNYGGSIWVESEPGKGATISIYLPAAKVVAPEKVGIEEAQEIRGGHEHILLVDDEALVVGLQKLMLESLGYQVTAQISSPETLEMFKQNPNRFDLLITDMTMPVMTGDQLAREVMIIRPDIPVIICTGFSEKITEEKIKTVGAQALVMKPFVRKDLAKAIRQVLDNG